MSALADLQNREMGNWSSIARDHNLAGPDYDYSKLAQLDSRGHGTDLGKLPWHPTFSTGSAYSSPEFMGGQWGKPTSLLPNSESYTPSIDMLRSGFTGGLADYMNMAEPNGKLLAPPPVSREYLDSRTR